MLNKKSLYEQVTQMRSFMGLTELRSHPNENINETFENFIKRLITKTKYDQLFISFRDEMFTTDINKDNKYETPTGVYSYPLIQYLSKDDIQNTEEQEFRDIFPYKNYEPYMYFIELKTYEGILDIKISHQ
jgi:hypothetical protein